MRNFFLFILLFVSTLVTAQINPNNGTVSNKSYSPAQAVTTDFRSWFYDQTNFIMRDYNGTSEVISYINLAKYRSGHMPIYVHSGGSLGSNGVWTGGTTLVYWFKDGVADGNLVRWYTDSTIIGRKVDTVYRKNDSTIGFTINQGAEQTFIIRGTAAGGSISSLVLNAPSALFGTPVNFTNTSGAWSGTLVINNQNPNYIFAGPSSGGPAAPTWRQLTINDIPSGIPNANLQNASIGFAVGTSGSAPNWTSTPVPLGGTATLNIPITSNSNTGIVNPTQFNFWTGKVDSTYMSNDSVYEFRNGTRFFRYIIVGGGGGGISSLNGLTGSSQTFATGTTGADFNISSSGTIHTFNIPTGSASNRGAISSADWSTFNAKQNALSGTGYVKFSVTTPSFLTPTQVTADLNLFTTSLQGLTPASGGGTVNFLRADGTWGAPPGTVTIPPNIGSGFRIYSPQVPGFRTLFCAGCTIDSTTNTNALTITVTAGGSGTVTSFSAGTLSPLFTTSVATATTTPALTFTLSSAAAYTGFGNWTNASAAPTFGKIPYQAFATGTANYLLGYDGSGNPTQIKPDTLFYTELGQPGDSLGWINPSTGVLTFRRFRDSLNFHHLTNTDGSVTFYSTGLTDPLTTNGDIIARIAGSTTRLAQGSNFTFLGVQSGTLGYYAPFSLTTTGTSGAATFVSGVLNIPQYSAGGGGTTVVDTFQVVTSGSTVTINNGVNVLIIDPSIAISSLTITLPAVPSARNYLEIVFGRAITRGNTVVADCNLTPNTGQTMTRNTSVGLVSSGDQGIRLKYYPTNQNWYNEF